MTDTELKRRVEDELGWDPKVNAAEIGVAVSEGVVTITGTVDSWPAKRAVEDAVKRVFGVTAVAEQIQIHFNGDPRTDTEIAGACAQALAWNTWVAPGSVSVCVTNGWVILEGRVRSQHQRAAAERAVQDLFGVRGVSNQIVLEPKASPSDVRRAIHAAFGRRALLDARSVGVDVDGTKVVLHGVVRTWSERNEAEEAAWGAPGVTWVENRVRVAS
jgi:osmotically-inducible protein OsmY